jgi:raffinose/stachyose/melibiose transport system permease protein
MTTAVELAGAVRRTAARFSPGDRLGFWIAIAPASLIFGVFTIVPIMYVIYFSFTDYSGFVGTPEFIGLENYARILSGDAKIMEALGHTAIYAFFYIAVQLVLAFLLALLMQRTSRLFVFYRSAFFLPVVISAVAVVFTWQFMFDPNTGSINAFLHAIGLDELAQDWLGNYDLALYSVIAVDLWRNIGFSLVIFIAGLGTIPSETIEAARMDGAGPFTMLRHITVPLMRPTFGLVAVLAANGALRAFDTVFLMTGGGPGSQTELYMTLAFDKAFQARDFGLSSAMSILVVLVLVPLAILQNRLGDENRETRRRRRSAVEEVVA